MGGLRFQVCGVITESIAAEWINGHKEESTDKKTNSFDLLPSLFPSRIRRGGEKQKGTV